MITCLGLVVGAVTSADRHEVLKQCAKFIDTHRYLNKRGVQFEIDGVVYATVYDTHDCDDGYFAVLFIMYDRFTDGVQVKRG